MCPQQLPLPKALAENLGGGSIAEPQASDAAGLQGSWQESPACGGRLKSNTPRATTWLTAQLGGTRGLSEGGTYAPIRSTGTFGVSTSSHRHTHRWMLVNIFYKSRTGWYEAIVEPEQKVACASQGSS